MNLPIDYRELRLLIVLIFAVVGIMRGWYREGITSLFVAVLGILVWRPDIGQAIIDWINEFISFVLAFIRSGFSFDPQVLAAQRVPAPSATDPSSYPYRLWTMFSLFMVIVSYVIGETTFKGKMTPLGRILGGILGMANGFVLFSVGAKFLSEYWRSQGLIVPQSGSMTIQLTNVPTTNLASGYGILFLLIMFIAVIALLIVSDRRRWPL